MEEIKSLEEVNQTLKDEHFALQVSVSYYDYCKDDVWKKNIYFERKIYCQFSPIQMKTIFRQVIAVWRTNIV